MSIETSLALGTKSASIGYNHEICFLQTQPFTSD